MTDNRIDLAELRDLVYNDACKSADEHGWRMVRDEDHIAHMRALEAVLAAAGDGLVCGYVGCHHDEAFHPAPHDFVPAVVVPVKEERAD